MGGGRGFKNKVGVFPLGPSTPFSSCQTEAIKKVDVW